MKGKFNKNYFIIKNSGLFDEAYYLKHYDDVRRADIDPIEHYVLYGWKEGRNPAPWFDTKFYLENNPDVAQAGVNPFVHWIRWGRKEGRKPNPEWKQDGNSLKSISKIAIFLNILQNIKENPYLVKKFISHVRIYGLKGAIQKALAYSFRNLNNTYECWISKNEPTLKELKQQRKYRFNYQPKISIIVPVFNTPRQFLIEMIESVLGQTYPNWELCIVDGGSTEKYIKEILDNYSKMDKRIKVKYLSENKGIVGNSNEALNLATGDYITFLDHDDLLPPFALFEVVKAINENPDVDVIYSDEDKIGLDGKRFDPYFKPDWNPDLLKSANYITHLFVIKKELLDNIGWFREGFDGSQDYDLILRATEKAKEIVHLPKILYHWRVWGNSSSFSPETKMYAYNAGKKALEEHLKRLSLNGKVEILKPFYGWYKITYEIKETPLISIIIPNKDNINLLQNCLESIYKKSTYKNFEILIVENNSVEEKTFRFYEEIEKRFKNLKIIYYDKTFNWSAINNYAVNYSRGEVLLFLNNDTEATNGDFLERMVEHLQREEVGIVGAKLYFPDNTIQHAGVIVGLGGVAGHSHKHFPRNHPGYFGRLISIQNLSAVTGACMMVKRRVFEEVGGFSEEFPVTFNDIDFCLKVREKGYLIVWTPYAELYHYESKTRGYDDTPEKQERFKREIERFQKKWKSFLEKCDPYYNPNLSLDGEGRDFSIRC